VTKNECILYLDINSLYSHVMMFKLPTNLIWRINELPKTGLAGHRRTKDALLHLWILTILLACTTFTLSFLLALKHYDSRLYTMLFNKN
jgi:hypothetical protein